MIGTARKAEWGLPCQCGPFSRISCIPKHIQTSLPSTDHTRNRSHKETGKQKVLGQCVPLLPSAVNYQHSVLAHC